MCARNNPGAKDMREIRANERLSALSALMNIERPSTDHDLVSL